MKRLAPAALAIVLAVAAADGAPALAGASQKSTTLHVFAAASLGEAFAELGQRLEKSRPGLSVRFNLAGSQQLATQLEQGAYADVFASADDRWMAYVSERGLVAEKPVVFARNRLVVIVPRTNPARIGKLQDLAKSGIKLVIGADAVPVGRYSRVMLQNLSRDAAFGGDFASRTLRNVVSEEENVRSVVGKVQLGEADAGIVYRSDVSASVVRFVTVLEIPESANVVASYPIALIRNAGQADAAKAFVELVLSRGGQEVLARRGLLPVAAPAP